MHSESAPGAHDPLDELHQQLGDWRQGDYFAGDALPMVLLFRRTEPATAETAVLADEDETGDEILLGELSFDHLVIVSQTCDVVEHPGSAPYVTLAPIVRIEVEARASEARRGYMPRYAPVPGVADDAFADLDLHLTIEKPVLRGVAKATGLRDDDEIRRFQDVTERHASRFAFPSEMTSAFEPLRKRIREKKDKDSFEGRALRLVDDIRLLATPNWDADKIDVDLFFLLRSRDDADAVEDDHDVWEQQRVDWQSRCTPNDRITSIRLILVPLDELDAATYRASDKLDLGGMSPQ